MLTTHGIAEGEWDGNEWVQYRWSCKIKDTEVLYWIHLEDLSQLEKEGDLSLQQEQPEMDLEKEYQEFCKDYPFPWSSQYVNREYIDELCLSIARHFYELGYNARREE